MDKTIVKEGTTPLLLKCTGQTYMGSLNYITKSIYCERNKGRAKTIEKKERNIQKEHICVLLMASKSLHAVPRQHVSSWEED